MKQLILCLPVILLSACSQTLLEPKHQYCSIADIEEPRWVQNDRSKGYLVTKFGIEYSREAERDVHGLLARTMARSIYTEIYANTQSTFDSNNRVTEYHFSAASNLELTLMKTDFARHGQCLAAWATIKPEDARLALENSHPINMAEHRAWQSIKDSRNWRDYAEHLEKFPQGLYADTCRARIDVLR
ncbi:hypothetical protein [Aliidiomarina sp. B3213]|uniref:hypothetical protein n=1 Tax=Aliidiomarina sp. B3213 TaxID=2249757 RepID=UPI000DCFAF58|nr:hypothetical protein [Aliidiomarina sp. B3213]RTE85844.1 hypothetical protein DQX04_10370 [Aliidiomarina sp. B3213]